MTHERVDAFQIEMHLNCPHCHKSLIIQHTALPSSPTKAGAASSNEPLTSIGLKPLAFNALKNRGVETIGQLAAMPRRELLVMSGIGPRTIALIEQALARKGLSMSPDPDR